MSFPRPSRRSGPCDTYYDERALYSCTNTDDGIVAVRKQYWDQMGRERKSTHDVRKSAKIGNDDRPELHATRSQPILSTRAGIADDTEDQARALDATEECGRVADWVKSQQIVQHVALPLSLFQAMVDRLIASEEAAEQLRNVAMASIREAYPVWKGPCGVHNDPPVLDMGLELQQEEEGFDHRTIESRQREFDAIKIHTSIADLRESLVSRRSLGRSDSKTEAFMKDVSASLSRKEPQRLDSGANSHGSVLIKPPSQSSTGSRKCRWDRLSPAHCDNALNRQQTDPSSWFDDSSSQASDGLVIPITSREVKHENVESGQKSMSWPDEVNGIVNAAPNRAVGTISVEAFESPKPVESSSKSTKSSQASRVVASVREGVGRFLIKHRLSRRSLRQCAASDRAPVPVLPNDLDAYLHIPEAPSVHPTSKMEPRSAIPERPPPAPTTPRSVPLLRA